MSSIYFVHIVAGTIGLVAGFVALFGVKGARVHRTTGLTFVYTMLAMCLGGLLIAVIRDVAPSINIPAALITAYLAVTALTTVRDTGPGGKLPTVLLLLVGLGVGVVMLWMGVAALISGGDRAGFAFPFLLFATFGLLGAAGDVRVLARGPLKGAPRLARHLWRMSMALLIAALSFAVQFVKLMKLRAGISLPPATIALPLLLILVTFVYWMWRVRWRKSLRGLVLQTASAHSAPSA
jgi:uncharacterized membrane protein